METREIFDSTKQSLTDLLREIQKGKIQLPDFQRGWVWDDNRIKGLLASVLKSYPISVVTFLEVGENVNFKYRPVEGAAIPEGAKPEKLILDGQQRLTSLYQAICTGQAVTTKNEKGGEIKRWYYIDIRKALDENTDLEDAIFSINEKKIITENLGRDIKLDLRTPQDEYKNCMFPISCLNDAVDWRQNFQEHWDYDKDMSRLVNTFEKNIIRAYDAYNVPVITMKKENPREAVCQVFEKVNMGGVSLTVFELLTATFAAYGFDLAQDWKSIKEEFKKQEVLKNTSNTDFIQAVTLLSTYRKRQQSIKDGVAADKLPAVSAKRKTMLELKLNDYQSCRDDVVKGMTEAAKLLRENAFYEAKYLPYTTQLVPMSAIIAALGDLIVNLNVRDKIMRWFWCGVFGELYGSANETRYALDIAQAVEWCKGAEKEPTTIYDSVFFHTRLHTLCTRNSAAYKGVYSLLLGNGIRDWRSGTKIDFSTYDKESIDIHHIFPQHWCEQNHIPKEDYNCIINKTALSKGTNIFVSGEAPSIYLKRIENKINTTEEGVNELISAHLVNPELIRKDDFYAFMADRKEAILRMIEKVTGKAIAREQSVEEGVYTESDEDEE